LLAGRKDICVLVEHGVEGNSGLSGLTVTNDQLTLTTSNGNHGVDGLETSLYGLLDGLAGQDTGGLELSTAALSGLEGTLSVDGVTESVNDTSEKSLADGNVDNLSGTLDGLAFLDQTVRTEKHDTDLTGFQVHAHALDTGGEPVSPLASMANCRAVQVAYSTSSSAWTLFMPWTRAIPSPTESTRPVSERLFSSWTPRILCSRMEETSVGVAFASAA
jgi:hypothetical protein